MTNLETYRNLICCVQYKLKKLYANKMFKFLSINNFISEAEKSIEGLLNNSKLLKFFRGGGVKSNNILNVCVQSMINC
jgi:hypothetical protein